MVYRNYCISFFYWHGDTKLNFYSTIVETNVFNAIKQIEQKYRDKGIKITNIYSEEADDEDDNNDSEIKIIKHGKCSDGIHFTCCKCDCEFVAKKESCSSTNGIIEREFGKRDYYTSYSKKCPECGKLCIVDI